MIYPNQPIHLFLTRRACTSKTFTLLFIQGFLKHYNKQLSFDPLKQKTLLMAYLGKTTFNIDGITVHFGFSLPQNCKHLHFLSLERLDFFNQKFMINYNFWC